MFGWWHAPADARSRGGVLLCPPLGFDYLQSHRALRVLADDLAAEGFCVVRFDYDGTGDSAGGGAEARLAAWTATARSALSLLRRHAPSDVCLVGMRLGGTFAAMVADLDGAVDQLVLWDPCASGRSFLAEQRALQRLSGGKRGVDREGYLESPGFVYEPATVEDIDTMHIPRHISPLSRRVLVLTRDDRPADASLHEPSLAGETLTHGVAAGQHELLDLVPPNQQLPLSTIRRIVTWLSQGAPGLAQALPPPEAAGPAIVASDPRGRPIVETPVAVPPVGLFGILTEPGNAPSTSGTPTIVLLNAGNHHHVGPARMWVDWSRAWATDGMRSLRLDLSGLGDSPFRDPEGDRWRCNKPEGFDDVADAAHWASPEDPSNVVLMGLCSSGYQAIESGLVLQARGVVAVNPSISFEPPERRDGAPLDPRRRIALPKDHVAPTFRQGGRLGWLRERHPDLAWRVRTLLTPSRRSGPWLAELVRNGTDAFIICGDMELRPIRQGLASLGLRRLRQIGLLRLEHVPGLGHVLPTFAERELVRAMISGHLRAHLAPNAGRPWSDAGRVRSSRYPPRRSRKEGSSSRHPRSHLTPTPAIARSRASAIQFTKNWMASCDHEGTT